MPRFVCTVCGFTQRWPTYDQAGRAATWHIYENHPDHWVSVMGNRPPADLDPRKAA